MLHNLVSLLLTQQRSLPVTAIQQRVSAVPEVPIRSMQSIYCAFVSTLFNNSTADKCGRLECVCTLSHERFAQNYFQVLAQMK